MEFQFLGTAAVEGIPAVWCECENCRKSRKTGGRALRTRSQARINTYLLDFPPDTDCHILQNGIDMAEVHHCLITHAHTDHLYPEELMNLRRRFAFMKPGYHITFYGSDKVGEKLLPYIEKELDAEGDGTCDFQQVEAFVPFMAGAYAVTPLPAVHDPKSGPLFYQIREEEKTVLYANDTHFFCDEVWAYWKETKPYFAFVSLDCTNACLPYCSSGHMGLEANVQVRERMLAENYADENTIFVCNHFSHDGTHVAYDDFVPIAAEKGFRTSYDGMCITV